MGGETRVIKSTLNLAQAFIDLGFWRTFRTIQRDEQLQMLRDWRQRCNVTPSSQHSTLSLEQELDWLLTTY